MTWIGKTALTIAGIGFAGGGATLAGLSFMPPPKDTFAHYLNKQGRTIIAGDESKWNTVREKYNSEGEGLLITVKGNEIAKAQLTSKELKEWCEENSKKEFTNIDDSTYQRVSAWCTENKTISQKIPNNKQSLNTDEPSGDSRNVSESDWESKKRSYEAEDNKDLINLIEGDSVEKAEIPNKPEITTAQIRKWCKFSKDKHFKHEKDARYLKYLKWCVN